jgi:hypothetical protein
MAEPCRDRPQRVPQGDLDAVSADPRERCRADPRVSLWHRLIAGACVLGFALVAAHLASAQPRAPATERGVKAAFLYKFLDYVEWPPGAFTRPDQPIVVGVLGADDLQAELADAVRGRTVGDRPVDVRRVRPGEGLAGLNVLFVGAAEHARIGSIARSAQGRGLLIVSESDDALDAGGTINFVVQDGRVRFEVALAAAERAGIKLSSRLLAVAQNVRMADR